MEHEPDYTCHLCNHPVMAEDVRYFTEVNGVEYIFCSYTCLHMWDDVDETEDEYN